MSKTVEQIYGLNPTTVVADTDLYYLVQSPYTPGSDAAISGASLKAAFGSGGTINAGTINQIAYYAAAGTTLSGTSTIPSAVQDNITRLGTISSIGAPLGGAFGGTGVNNGASTITIGGNVTFSGAFTFTGTVTGNTSITFPTSGTLATTSQLPTPSALTKTDDTNVTLTLGGSPTVALLAATSLTLGWTGTLSGTRGGTGVNNGSNTATYAGNLNFASSFTTSGAFSVTQTYTGATNVTFPTSGTLATTSQLPTPAALTKVDDTNVTLTLGGTPATSLLQATSLTLGWTGTLSGTRGGTGVNNGSSTITIGGNVTFSGAFTTTLTVTGNTSVTLPTSGTLMNTTTSLAASQLPTGSLFNFQSTNTTTTSNSTSSTFADISGMTVSITPTSSSNKVLVRAVVQWGSTGTAEPFFRLARGGSAIGVGAAAGSRTLVGAAGFSQAGTSTMGTSVLEFLDSPATTSSTTYTLQWAADNAAGTIYCNQSATDTNTAVFPRASSTISVIEVKV